MRYNEIRTGQDLWQFMTRPSETLTAFLAREKGDISVLGGSGKMGKELTALIKNADKINGVKRNIFVASTFSNPEDKTLLEELGAICLQGDISSESFLKGLPVTPHMVYMVGFKFGSSGDYRKAFHINSIVPYLVGSKYGKSNNVVFSSGNPYPHTSATGEGCVESEALQPTGIYGWTIIARESSFKTTAMLYPDQKNSFYRLMYAQHLNYGVLVDLARMVKNGEPVSLAMPAVNLISQRDANEIAIRCLGECLPGEGLTLNVAGPVWQVRDIVERIAHHMGKKALFAGEEHEEALLANDALCRSLFGEYRDRGEEMIEAAAHWIKNDGLVWHKPTYFGKVNHQY